MISINETTILAAKKNYLLAGLPGTGKTTVIVRLARELGKTAVGFYTAEVREGGRRRGFEIVSLGSGLRAVLADVKFDSPFRVGKYGVRPENLHPFLEEIEKECLEATPRCLFIDEIGKMELFSRRFREAVLTALVSPHPLVATIMARPEPFCDNLKRRVDVKVLEVNRANRETMPQVLLTIIRQRQSPFQ